MKHELLNSSLESQHHPSSSRLIMKGEVGGSPAVLEELTSHPFRIHQFFLVFFLLSLCPVRKEDRSRKIKNIQARTVMRRPEGCRDR